MEFQSKKEEFICWICRSEVSKVNDDVENCLNYLTVAKRTLEEIKKMMI